MSMIILLFWGIILFLSGLGAKNDSGNSILLYGDFTLSLVVGSVMLLLLIVLCVHFYLIFSCEERYHKEHKEIEEILGGKQICSKTTSNRDNPQCCHSSPFLVWHAKDFKMSCEELARKIENGTCKKCSVVAA